MREGRTAAIDWEIAFYELALKVSGAVQAARWTAAADGRGYIYSFNGPHSLFVDTIRSLRVAGGRPPARPRPHGRRRRSRSRCCSAAGPARRRHRGVQRLLRRGPRRLRRPRARRRTSPSSTSNDGATAARSPSRATRRSPPGPAGSAWVMLGYAEQLEFLDRRRRGLRRRSAAATAMLGRFLEGRHAPPRLLSSRTRRPTASRTGTPARPTCTARRLPRSRRPILTTTTSRSTAPPPPSPRRVSSASAATSRPGDAAAGRAYWQAGLTTAHAVLASLPLDSTRPTRACSCTRSTTGPTAGTTSRRAARSRAASPACGATTTPAKSPSSFTAWRRDEPYYTFFAV